MRNIIPLQTHPMTSLVMPIHKASLAVLLWLPKCAQLAT